MLAVDIDGTITLNGWGSIHLDALAKLLKIERGNDFLFYLYMLLSGWGLIRSHIRINKLSSSLNKLSSQMAINSPIILKTDKTKNSK